MTPRTPGSVQESLDSTFKWDGKTTSLLLMAIIGKGGDDVMIPMGPNTESKMKIVKNRFEKLMNKTVDEKILWENVKKLKLRWGPGC